MLAVDETTVRRDNATNVAPDDKNVSKTKGPEASPATNVAPTLSGAAAAKAVERAETKEERKAEKEKKIAALTAVVSATGPFDVAVIDPPWPMQKIDRDVRHLFIWHRADALGFDSSFELHVQCF